MKERSYLAIDLGASSGRIVIGTLEEDRMRMEEVHRFPTPILEVEGHLFWDVDALWEELQVGIRLGKDAVPTIRSISADSWAVDYVPLDHRGEALRRPYCYRDPRTIGTMENAFRKVTPDEIYARTGIQFLPFNTLYQMLADAGSERKCTFLTIADYFNFRLSGRAAIEVSMASTTQLMDVYSKVWSEPLLRAFDISWERLPEIVASGTRLGAATDEPDVTVVASCSHDTGCAVAAVPALNSRGNWAFISCGTWSLMGIERAEPILSEDARLSGFTNEAGIDGTIRFLKNLSGLWPLQECAREWGNPDWEELEKEAHSAQRSRELIDLEDASFLARGSMEERLRIYCRRHGLSEPETRGRLARLILESIADGYRRCLTDLERVAGETCEILYLVGGGSRNRLLCELTAEKCNLPVMAGPAEATALGNLLIQARTMDDLPPKRSIRDFAFRSGELRLVSPGRQAQEYV